MQNAAALDHSSVSAISPRAVAICRGLRRTGRIRDLRAALSGAVNREDDWVIMPATREEFYFLRRDGAELRRGDDWISSEPLQAGFVDAMARCGGFCETEARAGAVVTEDGVMLSSARPPCRSITTGA